MNDLEKLLLYTLHNRKKILGATLGFILAYFYIKYGFASTLILAIFTIIGYNYSDILKKVKIFIRERMDEEQ